MGVRLTQGLQKKGLAVAAGKTIASYSASFSREDPEVKYNRPPDHIGGKKDEMIYRFSPVCG